MKRFSLDGPFDLDLTVSCGQAFRWYRTDDGFWHLPYRTGTVSVRQNGSTVVYRGWSEDEMVHYFALDLDLDDILSSIDVDPLIHGAVVSCRGLRICRQPPFECLISYLCASCSNIPMISKRIGLLAETFGTRCGDGCLFPSPDSLAEADCSDIRACKTGYRDVYIHEAAARISSNPSWADEIRGMSYDDAKKTLMTFRGIGDKVADCILLFGFGKYEAVPVDVWIERIIRTKYMPSEKKLPYSAASSFARSHFGKYAGYAQEYLYAERERLSKRGD